jgi:ABC-2 type transport system ATP-binding protein
MIELKNVTKKYKKLRALDDVSLTINEGKITALLGINGVGKSTILKAIMKLINIDSGEILIDGDKQDYKMYDKIAMIPDVAITYPKMSIKEAFEFMKFHYKNWDETKAYDMLKFFKLTDEKKIIELSKGNMARVKLILGFAQNSKYLLMDEPFSGMDMFTREDFIGAMSGRFMEENQSIVITTHEIAEIEHIADQVILLEDGKVIKEFSAEECREKYGKSIIDVMREVYRGV